MDKISEKLKSDNNSKLTNYKF